ncbi:hypothetical protein EYR41_000981 [Orbilia oligospora]|uniref:PXA domain-containing protein n=1 Tax=Orbilia oligospora TaxID=2813651 RepID=A0A8H2EAW6_ORBOL|nr:hypothetical protein EYR41_000981 [Orbilia oligospora]
MPLATSEASGSPPVLSTLPTAAEYSLPAQALNQDEELDSTPRPEPELSSLLPPGPAIGSIDTTAPTESTNDGNTTTPNLETKLQSEDQVQPLLDRLLSAISGASETTLIAGFSVIALVMSTVFGRIGLLLVGTFLGAMLHAALQNQNGLLDVVKSLAKSKDSIPTEKESSDSTKEQKAQEDIIVADFSSLNPKVGSALDELCNAVVKDCINSWYMPLIPDDSSFPATCHHYLAQTFLRFSKHMNNKRPADVFFWSVINISGTMTTFMQDLSRALSVNRELKAGVQAYTSANPKSDLAELVHRGQQDKKLRELSSDILQQFAPRDLKSSEPVALFLKNIVRSVILWNMVEKFSDPDFINEWIIHFLEQKESAGPTKEGVGAVLQAFDRSVAGAAQGSLPKVSTVIPQESKSATQSPTARKENFRPAQTQTNGINGTNGIKNTNGMNGVNSTNGTNATNSPSAERPSRVLPLEVIRNGNISNRSENDFEGRKSLEMRSASQNQSPVDSPPRSPIEIPTKRASSSASSHASVSELSMTPQKTSSESSRSGIYPSQAVEQTKPSPGLGLLNGRVTVVDTGPTPDPTRTLRSKPKNQFMIQLEPMASAGRIVMRTYQDFENLHNTLFSVARISGCEKYMMAFSEEGLPTWRNRSIDEVVAMLEFYLRMALSEEPLVKTEALYKFFEKDEDKREREKQLKQETPATPWRSSTSLENMGKNLLGTITKAPQSASEGGKAFFGGIKKALTSQTLAQSPSDRTENRPFGFISNNASRAASRARLNEENPEAIIPPQDDSLAEPLTENRGRFSIQLTRRTTNPPLPPRRSASVAARSSNLSTVNGSDDEDTLAQSTPSLLERDPALESENITMTFEEPLPQELDGISLPPPPSEIDNYDMKSEHEDPGYMPHIPPAAIFEGITETETQYVLEIMFSIINELYGLSTAWMIRRSFLNIAKSVILRPGNSQLAGMRNMIQSDVLEANTKPEVIADYIRQVRKNALPTPAEAKKWEQTKKPRTDEEKEELRQRARVLLSESLPQGLTALLGVNQTKEAMYQLFDALQERDIARGLWTAILCGTMKFVCQ